LAAVGLISVVDRDRAQMLVRDGLREEVDGRIAPLFFRGVRSAFSNRVGGLRLDFAGRPRLADVFLVRSEKP
jgi:hypothetical protein